MRKLFATAAIAGTLTAGAIVTGVGTAAATPPPPSPQCSLVTYPLVYLIEATGGQDSPLRPVAQAIVDAVCH
ncbi:hypothetical protein IU501_18785 [Nocardia otitidiscaviarum]|uniref:hypothetical protein n=1 Tax=Nocardia otitidiscaviarum TaxID=1823 RepID=UPI0004A75C00|nr:hypothetical protein [Nocardia otitidiscaviarum]MBF6135040.1 hypothetical protein [Nocardia otitidiscaviarum]MBF6486863.1 hypothetical protein [Nocardia otitidiscaviarum]